MIEIKENGKRWDYRKWGGRENRLWQKIRWEMKKN